MSTSLAPQLQPETPQERLLRGLRMVTEAAEQLLAAEPAPAAQHDDPFVSVDEACRILDIRGSREWRLRSLRAKARNKGWLRRDGRSVVIERPGFMRYVRSLPSE